MGCVNRSSKEFKELATRNNVDSNTLELITHQYWLERKDESLLPTDVYIQAQLGNSFYKEPGKAVRKLWEKRYASPLEFTTFEEMQAAYNEAAGYFPKSAIVYYQNGKGSFVLSVKRPVEKINYGKEEYLNDLDSMRPVRSGKTLRLGINENQTYGIGKVQELYNKFNTDRTSQHLADKVFSLARDLGLNVKFTETLGKTKLGNYVNTDHAINYRKSFLEGDGTNDKKANILLHEAIHAVTSYALSNNTENWKRPKDLEKFRTEMYSIYQDLRNNPLLKDERGIVNVKEFVAELSNPVFRAKIQEIDKANKEKQPKKSLWQRVLDAFKSLLGIHVTDSYYQRSMNALDKALSAFDIDTYMRYNNLKSPLRKAFNKSKVSISDIGLREKVADNLDTKTVEDTINEEDSRLNDKNNKQYEQGIKMAGSTFESAFNLLKDDPSRMVRSSQEETSNGKSLREQLHEESTRQQGSLINWATKNGKLIVESNDYYEEKLGAHLSGSESKVWRRNNGITVVKNISLNHYGSPLALLERILIHNMAFPNTAMSMKKVGTSDNGMSIVVEQPFIEDGGILPSMEEIQHYMTDTLGFTLTKGKGINAEYSKDNYIVSDIRPENVIKQPDGTLAVIDCYAKFKEEAISNPRTIKDFMDSMSDKELREELSLTKREEDDYDLVNGTEEQPKKSGKAVPQDFTFNDGTTIKAPFRPNEQQVDALNAMSDFIKSNETSMTLSGYAGTGKTSLMEMVAKKCLKEGNPVMFCATTNKAAAVLNDRVSKAGFKATTLNKTFGISVEVDTNAKSYNARNLVNNLRDVDIMPGTTVIIDEASMINEENYRILNHIADENGLKIIYVGDEAQLPPVNEDKISKVFRNGDGKVIGLTQVERTDDNAILKEATDIRNGKPLSGVSSFNGKGEGVAYILPKHQDAIDEVIGNYVNGLREDPNHFRILAYTNQAVSAYNTKVRRLLGYNTPTPQVGEPMAGYANWGYNKETKSYRFINSESYKVLNTGKPQTVKTKLDDGTLIVMEAVPITLEDSMGNTDTFNFMDIKGNPQNRKAAMRLANEKKSLFAKAKRTPGKEAKAQIYNKINALDGFLFVNDNIIDDNNNYLQTKTIDFGYAMTVHKSQGSTFTNVLLDDVDISRASLNTKGNDADNAFGTMDTREADPHDLSQSRWIGEGDDVDLGDLSEVESTPSSPSTPASSQSVNLRQQLEYVGVSRATDTVTIISNNVKKEGSPLHPEDNLKEDSPMTLKDLETKIQSDSQKMRLSDDERYYVDEDGNKYARVTSVITTDADRFDPSSPWALPSSNVGTGVDVFVRDFFDGNIGNPDTLSERYPNASQESLRKLYDELQKIKEKIDGKFTIVSKDVTLKGQIPVTDKEGNTHNLNVAGTVDLLIYDDKGNFYIYDMKTHHSNKEIYKDPNKLNRYTKQVSLYKTLFEQMYPGHNVKGLALMPIHVEYPTPKGFGNGTAEYSTGNKPNQLLIDGKEFKGANPTLEKTIPVTPQKVEIHYEDLTNEARELIDSNDTINSNDQRSIGTEPHQGFMSDEARQLVEHLKSMGLNVLGRADMEKFFKEHPNMLVQMARAYSKEKPYLNSKYKKQVPQILDIVKANKYDKPGTDAVTLESGGHKTIYLIDHSADKELADNLKKGDGFGIRKAFNVDKLSKDDCRTIIRNIAADYGRSEVSIRRKLQNLGIKAEHMLGIDIAAELKMGTDVDAGLVLPRGREGFSLDNNRSGSDGRESKEGSRQENRIGDEGIEFFMTPQGEVYGFVDKNGNIYLDETKINAEHPIHEYTHLWDRVVAQKNPQLWNRGVELMKQTSLWNDVLNDDNYGKKWQAINDMTQEKLDQLIASEVHAKLTGEEGEALLDKIAKEKGKPGIIAKLKQWILDVWKDLKATFSPWSKEDLDKLTLKDFNHMTVRDFTEGINPLKTKGINTNTEKTSNQAQEEKTAPVTPTLEEGQNIKVSLPGYENYNELYDNVPVDAEWKVSYLRELDAQINGDKSAKKIKNIINQMNMVLQADSEKEYKQELGDSKKKRMERRLAEYKKFTKQLDELLNGTDKNAWEIKISATEVRHAAGQIADEISDEITRLQTEEGRAKEIFPELKTKIDFKTATRKQIVEAVNINRLIDRVKMKFDIELDENIDTYDDSDVASQACVIFDNWDAMMSLASDVFAFNEGFGISRDYDNGHFKTTSNTYKTDFDNFNDYGNDEDVIGENGEKDEQEHWQVEMRTIDVLNSMSALVRQGLHECYLLDKEGNKVMSKWGIPERVSPRKVTNSILRWTQGSSSLDDMVEKLSAKQDSNPWLSQLIDRLSDKTGKDTDFQSQFYGVFSKHFQLYSIGLTENGKYYSMPVNAHPALTDAMKTIVSKYKIGEHPLFQGNKVNAKALGTDQTTGKDSEFNLHRAEAELGTVNAALEVGKDLDDDMVKTVINNVLGVCRLLGYNITEDLISDAINAENIHTWYHNVRYMVKDLGNALKEQRQGKLKNYEPFGFFKENNIRNSVSNFLVPVVEKLEDDAVNAFYDSGKMYQSYVTPSFMTKLMQKFKQRDLGKRQDFIMEEYGDSEWFVSGYDHRFEPKFRNRWLDLLYSGVDIDHKVELNFNKHNYMRNMTDAEYAISLITEYYSESKDTSPSSITPAWFRVPMLSNKPSSEFIKFYSHRGDGYKDSIVHELHDIFLQELSRIQTVRMRNLSKRDPGFIKNFDTNGRKFCFLPVFNAYLENTASNKAKRELLCNGEDYDADRLNALKQKEEAWKEAYNKNAVDDEGNINLTSDDLKEMQLTPEEKAEYEVLKEKKAANDRALTTEENNTFAELLQKKLAGEVALSAEEEVEFGHLADKILYQNMDNRIQNILAAWSKNGILEAARGIKGIYDPNYDKEAFFDGNKERQEDVINNTVRGMVENFLWNDSLASKNILQLTIGDIAFYKDVEDLQKRLAQLHAPGIRANVNALDYDGNRVSDGKYRTFILKDFDTFISNIIANISEVFDRRIAAAKSEDQKKQLMNLKDSLVRPRTYNEDGSIKDEGGKYWNINVTDAQGYSSPTSYRKKAFLFGKWSRHAEDIYQKLKSGEYTYTDLEAAFQPLKPFVYTRLTKDLGVENAPIHTMHVPFQAKNAEYLLVMADAILQGEELSRPNLLRAVYNVMEESAYDNGKYNGKGIDTVQFESAIKSGLQGVIDISQFMDKPNGEAEAYSFMKNRIYKEETGADGKRIYRDYDSNTYVHEASFDDYCLQQEVPEHFKDHSQSHGSQIRMITPSDLDLYTTDENGNQVDNYYEWKEPDGTVKRMKADEFRKEYEDTIAESIEDSINNLAAELHYDSMDKRERNQALSRILLNEITSSPRYGIDLALACSLDENGDFRIPKGDPIQAKRIEQLINSIIKNRVNKQRIAGGPIVQVSNFGTSRKLHIRFNDKKGSLIPLEEEYVPSEHGGISYKEYLKKNQGGIAYFEVFAPIWSNELVEKYSNADGSINVAAIEATDPELLKMVSYRIPTEDKYSCAPMKVVGFMPREAGDAIMLPYELTEIDDSDFDVDKRYVMRKDIPIKSKKAGDYIDELVEKGKKLYKEIMGTDASKGSLIVEEDAGGYVEKMVDSLVENPQKFPKNSPFRKALYSEYQKLAYETKAPTSGKTYRDNKIVDMTYAVLTNEMTADKILNPGGFDAPKKMGYMVAAYKKHPDMSWSKLQEMSISELKDLSYTDKDLTFADAQVQFYKQNAAAASLIGVFAVNKVAHATLEGNGIYLDVLNNETLKPFMIGDTVFGGKKVIDEKGNEKIIVDSALHGMMPIDATYDSRGNLIGKTLGSLVSASADAVKDPILNLMNINMITAGMLNTMLRLGMPFDDAALFLSQNIIERLLSQFNRENLSNYVTLDSLIQKWLDGYRKKNGLEESSVINSEPLNRKELVQGLTSEEHDAIDYKVLLAFQRLRTLTELMRKPTYATRFNSISSAVGPLIIDNLIMEHKMESFLNTGNGTGFYIKNKEGEFNDIDINDIFNMHPILGQFARTKDIAKAMFLDMPTGSNGFRKLLHKLPKGIADKMFSDKKLLDQFSNFYQSYLLIQSGAVNPSELGYYIRKFPKEFNDADYKKKYPNNALLQGIRLNVSNKSDNPYLTINITGMDEQQKEELSYAWIDLHNTDPELSQKLFNYSFFVAGVGFSPKTFMSLVPTYVKEKLKGYIDTYRNFPKLDNEELVINQFIRNNWDNNKLVPWKGGKDSHYNIDVKHNMLTAYKPEDIEDVKDASYIKTKVGNTAYLWHKSSEDSNGIVFKLIKPLGNNGEYLEMSLSDIKVPMSITKDVSEDNTPSSMKEESPQESNAEESAAPVTSKLSEVYSKEALADLIQKQVPKLSKEEATTKIEEINKYGITPYKKFLQNVFKQKGLELNEKEAINEFKKYC